jgi:hypothetical protein
MIVPRALPSGLAAPLLALLAGFGLACGAAAPAQAMTGLGGLFAGVGQNDRGLPLPTVARFVSDEGESFVLDRSAPVPLLRFQDSAEVLVLTSSQAARGDILYRDEFGNPVLRETRLGGVTLFVHGRPGGAPVAVEGAAQSLRLQAMSAGALVQRLALASVRASHAAGRLIVFDADEVTPGTEAVFADAATVAAEAVARLSGRRDGRRLVARLDRILFRPGARGEVRWERGAIAITVAPAAGIAGRPSSARIVQAAFTRR